MYFDLIRTFSARIGRDGFVTAHEAATPDPGHPAVRTLIAILFLEAAMVALGTILVIVGAFESQFTPLTIALIVTGVLVTLGVAFLGRGLLRRRKRMLGGVLTWQVLQLGCAILGFQGWLGPQWLGWVVLVPALAGVVLCLSRPVVAVYGGEPKGR